MKKTKTIKDFKNDVYLRESTSNVIEISQNDESIDIVLDRTIFFPEGGGQPSDTGTISFVPSDSDGNDTVNLEVSHVRERDGIVYHKVLLSSATSCNQGLTLPNAGGTVTCKIDWDNRFKNMQRHLGEHILSGVFADMYGGANRGFHMGEDYITIDIKMEGDGDYDIVTMDMALAAEKAANDFIWQNLPVSVTTFVDSAEAASMPLRKELTIEDEEITIVTVGDTSAPVDCVACCGTHPSTTAQVGLLKVYKVEKNKDMFRIYFDCGSMAMADYREKHRIISSLGDKHSAGLSDLEKKMAAEEEKNHEARAHLATLSKSLAALRADEIVAESVANPDRVCYRSYDDMNADDIMRIGKIAGPQLKKPALILSESEHTLLLFSDGTVHCGNLVRENASIYGGKGGGSDVQARAIFPDNSNIETFVDLIDKHLR